METTLGTRLTYEEYLRGEETNKPIEIVDGVPIVSPTPTGRHQRVVTRLTVLLSTVAPAGFEAVVSPWDWIITRASLHVRQPDVVVVTRQQVEEQRWLETPPLLAVEVLSPTSHERDIVTKRAVYAEAGLRWYWIVDPEEPAVLVLRNRDGRFVEHARARGREVLRLTEPFPVELRPADLTA